jgi:hypothetical protein
LVSQKLKHVSIVKTREVVCFACLFWVYFLGKKIRAELEISPNSTGGDDCPCRLWLSERLTGIQAGVVKTPYLGLSSYLLEWLGRR